MACSDEQESELQTLNENFNQTKVKYDVHISDLKTVHILKAVQRVHSARHSPSHLET